VQHEVGVQQRHVETRMLDVQDVASRLVERHIRFAGGGQPSDLGFPQQQKDAGDGEKQHRDTQQRCANRQRHQPRMHSSKVDQSSTMRKHAVSRNRSDERLV
jgi:hypothetical protein